MNHGRQIVTELKKEKRTSRVFSRTLDSGQRIAAGSVIIGGNRLLSFFESGVFCCSRPGFYNTCMEYNQKSSFHSMRTTPVFYLDSAARLDYEDTFNLCK
jgi:hypothetical protein